jgi:hypothetical protein
VPGTAPPQKSRRYDQAQILSQRYFALKGVPCFLRRANHSNHRFGAHTGANQTVPYGTALLRWRGPRHFVPGYDRIVPPGPGAKPFGATDRAKIFLNFAPFSPERRVMTQGHTENHFRGPVATRHGAK